MCEAPKSIRYQSQKHGWPKSLTALIRHTVPAVCTALAMLSGSGCGKCPGAMPIRERKELRIATSNDPTSLDPRFADERISTTAVLALYDGLFRVGPSGQPELSIAERVTKSSDGLIWTFHLRSTRWSNGDLVTAEDFERSFKSSLAPQTPAKMAHLLFPIKNARPAKEGRVASDQIGVKALDSSTLVIELESPTTYFEFVLAQPIASPLNISAMVNEIAEVTNGPFLIEEWLPKRQLTLRRNPMYWDAANVHLERVVFVPCGDPSTALNLFENGDLDWVGSPLDSLPVDAIDPLVQSGQLKTFTTAATLSYKFNTEHSILANKKVRRALCLSVDRSDLITHISKLPHRPAYSLCPPDLLGLSVPSELDGPNEARQLFQEGLAELELTPATCPHITLTVGTTGVYRQLAQALQQQWREGLGIHVNLRGADFPTVLSQMAAGDYDLGGRMWLADFADPINFLDLFAFKDGIGNETNWEDSRYQSLIQQAIGESDEQERLRLFKEAEAILAEEAPVMPVYHPVFCYLCRDDLTGAVLPLAGPPDFKWVRFQ